MVYKVQTYDLQAVNLWFSIRKYIIFTSHSPHYLLPITYYLLPNTLRTVLFWKI